jgi:RNA polymerase II subunit A small phosphatase-like protein
MRTTQGTPGKKPDASAGDSTATESKEQALDNIGGTPYAELKSAGEPRILDALKSDTPPLEKTSSKPTQAATGANDTNPAQSEVPETPANLSELPSTPVVDGAPNASGPLPSEEIGTAIATAQGATVADSVINDRTPKQAQEDVEMPDAPPAPPAEEAAQQTNGAEVATSLPPPPPAPRRGQQPAVEPIPQAALATTAVQQKWLLPPARSEFKGKKCLILDLDETLVHSSFKV